MLRKEISRRPPSRLTRLIEYFVTPSGHRLSCYLAGAGTLGLACVNFLPHTVCLDYYRDFIQHYSFGIPTPVPPDMQQRIDRAADKLNISESKKKLIKTFTVTGFNVTEIGSLNTIFGGWIGVPSNFYYKSVENIDRANIHVRSSPVQWNTESGKLLEKSLILSEPEQQFAFCRALLNLQGYKLFVNTLVPSSAFFAIYIAGKQINQKQNLYGRLFLIRYTVYAMLGIFAYGLCSFITDFLNFQSELEVDKNLADLGPDMIEAGLGFYTKLLNRNIAIREISGLELYTSKGNENYFMRVKAVPLTLRKAFFEEKLKELKNEDNATAHDGSEGEIKTSQES